MLAMLLLVEAVFKRLERHQPLNSASQSFTLVNDGAGSPYTASNLSSIYLGVWPFKSKFLMTARYLIFILLKRLSHDNCSSKLVKVLCVPVQR